MAYTGTQAQVARGSVFSIGTQAGFPAGTQAFAAGETFNVVGEVISGKFTGSKKDTVDATNMESGGYHEMVDTGMVSYGSLEITVNRVGSDAGQTAMNAAFLATGPFDFTVQLPLAKGQTTKGDLLSFCGIVSTGGDMDLVTNKQVELTYKIEITGPRYLAVGS